MHKFFFAPAVCANKKIPCQCKLRNIVSQLWIPTLPDRWPGSNWETGKAWVEGTRPDPHSTPSPPLSYKSHKSTGDKSKSAQSTNSPDAGKLTQKCQMSTKLRIMREKKEKNLKPEHLAKWIDSAFDPTSISPMNDACSPPDPPITFGDKSQPSNLKLIGMSIWCQRWRCEAEFLKVENLEIPRLWIPIREIPKPGQDSRPFCEGAQIKQIWWLIL